MRIPLITPITLIAGLLQLPAAGAMTVGGDVALLPAPPASSARGNLVSRTNVFAWAERSNVSVSDLLTVEVIPFRNNAAGVYDTDKRSVRTLWTGMAAPGRYDSTILHAEATGKTAILSGSITFDTAIIGINYRNAGLGDSDTLFGVPGTAYPQGESQRRLELNGTDNWFSISADRRTFAFQTVVRNDIDQLRILTTPAMTAVPVPAASWFFGSSLLLLGWMTHRQRHSAD